MKYTVNACILTCFAVFALPAPVTVAIVAG